VIAVLGPGGVGGLIAAALERSGAPVVIIAREETAALIAERGLHVESVTLGEFDARPTALPALADECDALIVATKATGLDAALERVSGAPRLVVPLLNGLDHLALLRDRYGTRAVAGSIRVESDRPEPGLIVHSSRFLRIEMASADRSREADMRALGALLEAAEIESVVRDSEAQVMWSKLVRLNALACTTSASGLLLGGIRDDPYWRSMLDGAVVEVAMVAAAEGAHVDPERVRGELAAAHPTLGTSMARDLVAGREPELDAIPGSVLRAAARHGLSCPVTAELVGEIVERYGVEPPQVTTSSDT
jgi:2-dehydropantoate 2-reductase